MAQELTNVFISADADGNGYLDRLEMFTVMTNAGLSLNQKELNTLMVAVDEDEDGKVWPPRACGNPSTHTSRR